jgi:hypothetical protein
LIVSPAGDRLFLSVGSDSNVNVEDLPRASVQILHLDGTNNATFAFGLRNTVGIDFHPKTGALYVAVQERDALGDDLVPDFFTKIENDQFYGWPFGIEFISIFIIVLKFSFSLYVTKKCRSTTSFSKWYKSTSRFSCTYTYT